MARQHSAKASKSHDASSDVGIGTEDDDEPEEVVEVEPSEGVGFREVDEVGEW